MVSFRFQQLILAVMVCSYINAAAPVTTDPKLSTVKNTEPPTETGVKPPATLPTTNGIPAVVTTPTTTNTTNTPVSTRKQKKLMRVNKREETSGLKARIDAKIKQLKSGTSGTGVTSLGRRESPGLTGGTTILNGLGGSTNTTATPVSIPTTKSGSKSGLWSKIKEKIQAAKTANSAGAPSGSTTKFDDK